MKYALIGIVLLLILIILYIINNYKKIKELDNNIKISFEKINDILVKKKELLEKIVKDTKVKELKVLIKIPDDSTIYEKEDTLFNIKWKINKLINEDKYKLEKEYLDYYNTINSLDEDLEGLKDYYNNKALIYNEIYLKKPFTYIYKLLKIEAKKSFKFKKIENFEIEKD